MGAKRGGERAAARVIALAGLFTLGCAGRSSSAPAPAPAESRGSSLPETAQALYSMGEARYASGDYMGAVRLWRDVYLNLPEGAVDERRKLVERMAHTLVQAHLQSGDPEPLLLAQRMLDRYVELRLEGLEPGDPQANTLEGCVELLAAIDHRVEALVAAAGVEAAGEGTREGEGQAASRDGAAADALASRAATSDEGEAEAPRGDGDDGENVREIIVHTGRFRHGDLSMVGVRRFFAPGLTGGSLFDQPAPAVPPQALVRIARIDVEGARASTERRELRRQVRALVDARRPALRACFEAALARVPRSSAEVVLDLEVEVAVDAAESRGARVRSGGVLDHDGDRCVLEALAQDDREAREGEAVTVNLALSFVLTRAWTVDPDGKLGGPRRGDDITVGSSDSRAGG